MNPIRILGAGPAGSSAAIAARLEGAPVMLVEKSRFPRHKVCGEFLSPEIRPVLESLGAWDGFCASGPATVRRLALHFRRFEKRSMLPEPAFGLSRYRFDQLLFELAGKLGAETVAEAPESITNGPTIIAHGRRNPSARGGRLFGFKAHFDGPVNDAVELFFFSRCYVGVSAVENNATNVCGLGPEDVLSAFDFDLDAVVNTFPPLKERLAPLRRSMKWLTVGPLVFRNQLHDTPQVAQYPAGDALSFVDPFTGSGLLSAVTTGRLAGIAAARGTDTVEYLRQCRQCLEKPFAVSSLFRSVLASGWADRLVTVVPSSWLVRFTRPRVSLAWN